MSDVTEDRVPPRACGLLILCDLGVRRFADDAGKNWRISIADAEQGARSTAGKCLAPWFSAQGITQILQPANAVAVSLSCARNAPQRLISFFKLNAVQPHSHSC